MGCYGTNSNSRFEVQNSKLFLQAPHLDVLFDSKEVKLICAMVLLLLFLT